jgi:hypothetical protein
LSFIVDQEEESRSSNRNRTVAVVAAAFVVTQEVDLAEALAGRIRYSVSVRTFEEVDLKASAQTSGAYLAVLV